MKKIGKLLVLIFIGILGGIGGSLYQDKKPKDEKDYWYKIYWADKCKANIFAGDIFNGKKLFNSILTVWL